MPSVHNYPGVRRGRARSVAIAIAASIVTASSVVSAPKAAAKPGDLIIYNASNSTATILVCKDWTCSDSQWKPLYPGQNTRTAPHLKWQDADGVKLTPDKKYYVSTMNWTVWNNCGGATVTEKRSGSLADPARETWTVYTC